MFIENQIKCAFYYIQIQYDITYFEVVNIVCLNYQKIENSHLTLSRMHYTASNLQTGISFTPK